ncbi:HEL149Wp [Eremothecium sinecaudum]|uniref:Serine/threonine-protein kinase RAD53 n=1 Tax=Eremothecium sinecaudum TaxID=45286 RepID=A0A0X8HTF1_9SACH|nr:HEL149Wp [Eremothecium sinecaudum]AMD21132.1 HEL149Wp [Eremothecium sinecaudum]
MEYITQPTQQGTQATQKYVIEKFSQEQIDDDVVCRVICTTGQIKIQDLKAEVAEVMANKNAIKKVWTFGRNRTTCDYHLGDINRLSNKHFQIMLGEDGNLLLKDLSTNGTWLNNCRVEKSQNMILSQGDEITVGKGVAQDVVNLVVFFNDRYQNKLKAAILEGSGGSGQKGVLNAEVSSRMQLTGIFKDFCINDEVVGQGAFATVKKAVERKTGKTFAVKIINKRKVMGNIEGVSRELEILRRLNHPLIVSLKAFYEDDESYYLVMEFVAGGDLMDFVAAHGSVGEDAGREISRQILEAVSYIHAQGISHRDLKPDNILIAQDDPVLVKITDFGLAKIQGNGTFMKTFCGTLAYVAPEVIDGKLGDEQHKHNNLYSSLVDMWSMGCLIYVILTGHLPFSGSTQEQLYKQIARGSYHEGPLKDFKISEQARDFIDSLLQVNPQDRLTAEKALQHPWIRAAYLVTTSSFHVSLSQSLSQQKNDENVEKSLEESGNNSSVVASQAAERKGSQGPRFKVPIQPHARGKNCKSLIDIFPSEGSISSAADKSALMPSQSDELQAICRAGPAQNKRNSSKLHEGLFLSLIPTSSSCVKKSILLTQGVNPFVIGRADECHGKINDNRLSRLHCFILKKRHPVGNSIYESPAQGLDDIWYCHNGTNVSYVNEIKLPPGTKVLLQDGDNIKIIWDKLHSEVIAFHVRVHDPAGLFNNGRGMQGPRSLVRQTPDEINLATAFFNLKSNAAAKTSKTAKTDLQKAPTLLSSSHIGLQDNKIYTPSTYKKQPLPLSQDPSRTAKRAKLSQADAADVGIGFL